MPLPLPRAQSEDRPQRRLFEARFRHDRFLSILYVRLYLPLGPVTFADHQVVSGRNRKANRAVTTRILVGPHQAPVAGIQLHGPPREHRRVGIHLDIPLAVDGEYTLRGRHLWT